MDEELNTELENGDKAAAQMVEHLLGMGFASKAEFPNVEVDGQLFKLTVTLERNN